LWQVIFVGCQERLGGLEVGSFIFHYFLGLVQLQEVALSLVDLARVLLSYFEELILFDLLPPLSSQEFLLEPIGHYLAHVLVGLCAQAKLYRFEVLLYVGWQSLPI